MSESSVPSNDYRFSSQEFLGYQPIAKPITPSLTMADVTGTLWRLLYSHWLAIAVASVFGCLLPYVVLEHVFSIKIVDLDFDILSADISTIFWSLVDFAWVSLAMGFLIKHILGVEFGRSIGGSENLLKILPMLALFALLYVGTMIGLLLLVIPGVIFYVATLVALPVFLIENKTIRESIQQSLEMTRGSRRKIFWSYLGLYILSAILIFAIGSLIQALGQIGGRLVTFTEIDDFFGRMELLSDALLASSVYIALRKLLRGDEPDKLASVFD
jgi:hypothetical protein